MEFAILDLPEGERGSIFKHLGHSEEINTHVYQAPLVMREITTVGKHLRDLDTGKTVSNMHWIFPNLTKIVHIAEFKKEGILEVNKKEARKKGAGFERERTSEADNATGGVTL